MARERHLHHIKASKTTIGRGKPKPGEGSNGDITIRALRDGLFLFVKYGNFWYHASELSIYNPTKIHTNQGSGNSIQSGQGGAGPSGNIGIRAGSKLFLDTINNRTGIDGSNYIESGNHASTAGRSSTNADVSFMNLALDNKPVLILSGIKGSDGTPETLTFKSTIDHVNGPILHFLKTRSGSSGGDNNVVGEIMFSGPDKTVDPAPAETQWARIVAQVSEADHTDEAGKLSFWVAASDGTDTELVSGLLIEGEHATDGEVDVTIGAGSQSTTAIAGKLTTANTITSGSHIKIPTTSKLFLDGGLNTYIYEASGGDKIELVAGGDELLVLTEAGGGADNKVAIQALTPLCFDGGGDTYISEGAADELHVYVGGDRLLQLSEYGVLGNDAWFREASAGFTRRETTFSDTSFIGSGGSHDTDIDFRYGNKQRLEMTADIVTMNLIFPAMSANFLLVCTTDGDHDVTNWKVFRSDESAASTADVMWAGGSVPAFTTSGVDIVSFYWDSEEQQCYGAASLAFATP